MNQTHPSRYSLPSEEKARGKTYTPKLLADFVARQVVRLAGLQTTTEQPRVLDPAVGDGELLTSLLAQLEQKNLVHVDVYGFETDLQALGEAEARLSRRFPKASLYLRHESFLEFVLGGLEDRHTGSSASPTFAGSLDLIIANPPYVRTQILGSLLAKKLASDFHLTGRVDLYHAFLIGIAHVLRRDGTAGIIVSNRFMSTKSGAAVRAAIRERLRLRHIWDLGDTKLFGAAVLPAVLLAGGRDASATGTPAFTSIYETADASETTVSDTISALDCEGVVEVADGRRFRVQQGHLDTAADTRQVWRVASSSVDAWLSTVREHTWRTFGGIGKVRVGVKTCADQVFIRRDWDHLPLNELPELLRPLTTHHVARHFKAADPPTVYRILYPHEIRAGRRCAVELDDYPRARAYLERHRAILERRKYLLKAGRKWFEIWVPQNPATWSAPKLVFRDIAEEPTFWIDQGGTIVNGDCYWLVVDDRSALDLLWLAVAVGNSSFIKAFYDHRFHNRLYARRRRFVTQYVEQFPLPDPARPISSLITAHAKLAYEEAGTAEGERIASTLEGLVWEAFGLPSEKAVG